MIPSPPSTPEIHAGAAPPAARSRPLALVGAALLLAAALAPPGAEAQAPSTPENLTARPHVGRVALHWDWEAQAGTPRPPAQWNALTWELSQNGGSSWTEIAPEAYDQVGLTVKVRHTVTGLTDGTAYTFKVRTRNASGTSGESNTASATPSGTPAPGKPTLTVESDMPGGVTLTGQVDPSYTVTGWEMKQDTGAWQPANDSLPQHGPTLVAFVRGLMWDTAYSFQVRALNGATAGPASDAVSVTTQGKNEAVPAAPTRFGGSRQTDGVSLVNNEVRLWWLAPAATVTEYHLLLDGELQPGALTTFTQVHHGLTWTMTDVEGLTPGESYAFNVRAKNSNGTGPWSDTFREKLKPAYEAPEKPYLSIYPGDGWVELSFHVPWYPDRSEKIIRWFFQMRRQSGSASAAWSEWEVGPINYPGWDEMSAADRAQHPPAYFVDRFPNSGSRLRNHSPGNYTKYQFQVLAATGNFRSPFSDIVEAQPTASWAVPAAPTLSGTAGNGEVTLTWAPGTGGGQVTTWQIYQSNSDTWGGYEFIDRNTRSWTLTGLTNNTAYTFRVRGENSKGNGAASNAVQLTPSASAGGAQAPQRLTVTPGDGEAKLDWDPPPGGGQVTGYNYRQRSGGGAAGAGGRGRQFRPASGSGGWSPWRPASGTATSHTVTGLSNGRNYTFQVQAVFAGAAAGAGVAATAPVSNEASATPLAGLQTVPALPLPALGLLAVALLAGGLRAVRRPLRR